MKLRIALLIGLLLAVFAGRANETVAVPNVRVGDKWVVRARHVAAHLNETTNWEVRREVTKVARNVATLKYEMLPPTSPATGLNHYDLASQVMLQGLRGGTAEPARFPMAPGNEWKYEYEGRLGLFSARYDMSATVVGWEDVTVPAGTFRALRIAHTGSWSREADFSREGRTGTWTGSVKVTYWYAPAAKTMVKTLCTWTSSYRGTAAAFQEELVEFSLSGK